MPNALSIVKKFYPNVTEVQDSSEGMRIDVIARDVLKSQPGTHTRCPLAQACVRSIDIDGAIVSLSKAYLVKGDIAVRFEVGRIIHDEVAAVDRGLGFTPGQYWLAKPSPSSKRGGNRPRTGGKPTKQYHLTRGDGVRPPLGSV